jgi:serine/threonine protein kinase
MIDALHQSTPDTVYSPLGVSVERALLERRVREYQVVREIGCGAMGVVFLARDVMLHRLVAIKVLRHHLSSNEEQRERFRREARVTARLSEGVVAVHGFGERDDLVYIVMEFVRGTPLSARVKQESPLPIDEARQIILSLARTLDHAHTRGVVHRDLKPENVILEHGSGRPLLTDFGVALSRSSDPLPSEHGTAFGTPHFMSPEQAAGETNVDGRSDIYSLGVLGYLLLTGELPFDGDSYASIASKHIAEAPVPILTKRAEVPPSLAIVVEKCLRKEPADRWRTGNELAEVLGAHGNQSSMAALVSRLGRFAALIAAAVGLSVPQPAVETTNPPQRTPRTQVSVESTASASSASSAVN